MRAEPVGQVGAEGVTRHLGEAKGRIMIRPTSYAKRSPYHPFQGNEGRKDEYDDSGEGDGKVNVMHGAQRIPSQADQDAPQIPSGCYRTADRIASPVFRGRAAQLIEERPIDDILWLRAAAPVRFPRAAGNGNSQCGRELHHTAAATNQLSLSSSP